MRSARSRTESTLCSGNVTADGDHWPKHPTPDRNGGGGGGGGALGHVKLDLLAGEACRTHPTRKRSHLEILPLDGHNWIFKVTLTKTSVPKPIPQGNNRALTGRGLVRDAEVPQKGILDVPSQFGLNVVLSMEVSPDTLSKNQTSISVFPKGGVQVHSGTREWQFLRSGGGGGGGANWQLPRTEGFIHLRSRAWISPLLGADPL